VIFLYVIIVLLKISFEMIIILKAL